MPEISVVPYTTIKHYNSENKSNKKIGKQLLVDYLLISHLSQLENQSKMHVELFDISADTCIWTEIFNVITKSTDYGNSFQLEENLGAEIANALSIRLNTSEKQKMERSLTENEEAMRLYNLAGNLLERPDGNLESVLEAKKLLETAIRLDSTFSEAYSKLGKIYIGNLRYTPGIYLAEKYLDSSVIFNEKALILDKFNQEAIKGLLTYYTEKGNTRKARNFKARLSPPIKNYLFHLQEFSKYGAQNDYYNALESFYNYLNAKPVDETVPWWMYQNTYNTFNNIGFPDLAKKYSNLKYIIKNKNPMPEDCFETLLIDEFNGNYENGYLRAQRMIESKEWTNAPENFYMVRYWERKEKYYEACKYLDKMEKIEGPWGENWLEMLSNKSRLIYPFGYCYLKIGQTEKADFYFNRFIKKYTDEMELNAYFARRNYTYFEIAMVHAAMGSKEECMEKLRYLCQQNSCPRWFILELKNSPWFENVRQTKEYQQILQDLERKYQKEHDRVARLIEKYEQKSV